MKKTKPVYSEKHVIDVEKEPVPPKDPAPPKLKHGSVRKRKKLEGFKFWSRRKFTGKLEHIYLVKMFYGNGTSIDYVISTSDYMFSIGKKHYVLLKEFGRYNINMKHYELIYFEGYSMPANIKPFVKKESTGDPKKDEEVYMMISPSNLKEFIGMKFIEKVINPIDLEKWLKLAAIGGIIAAFFGIINIVISSGVIKVATG